MEGNDRPLLNMANFDFLGMGQRKELKAAAVQALDKVCVTHCMEVVGKGDAVGVWVRWG